MELKFKRWQDFNNLSIKVTINKKIYDAILNTDNNRLILKINMTKNINEQIKTMILSQEDFYLTVKKFSL